MTTFAKWLSFFCDYLLMLVFTSFLFKALWRNYYFENKFPKLIQRCSILTNIRISGLPLKRNSYAGIFQTCISLKCMYFIETPFFMEHFWMAASDPSTYFSGPVLGQFLWKDVKLWKVREFFKNTYEGLHDFKDF